MGISTLAVIGLAVVAIAAILTAVVMRLRIIYLQDVLATSYQLAGTLLSDDDDEVQQRMGLLEYNAACILLMDVLSAPDGPEAAALLAMDRGKDTYDQVLMSAKRVRSAEEGVDYRGPFIPTQ